MSPIPLIDLVDVRVEFGNRDGSQGNTIALDMVNLSIPRGQFVAIVGASGCGKTTLLNLVGGMLRPSGGTVTVEGERLCRPRAASGYMFARDGLLPWRTIRKNVVFGLEHRGWSRSAKQARSEELLELVGLAGFAKSYPRQLSQGMRQRAALARTLAPKPDLLLMDEPFAALDARTRLRLQAEFLRIWEGAGDDKRTVIFVTHDLQEALLMADRVLVMLPRPGRIAADQTVDMPRPRADHLGEIMFEESFRDLHHSLFELLEGDSNVTYRRQEVDS
jgi:NitT/TauT family transport system ATP-binding protein